MHFENSVDKLLNFILDINLNDNLANKTLSADCYNYESNNFYVNHKYFASSIPSCSFSTSSPTEANEAAKAAAVNKELAFGCKIFKDTILQDQNRNKFITPTMFTSILPLQYEQTLIEEILIQLRNSAEEKFALNNVKVKSYEKPETHFESSILPNRSISPLPKIYYQENQIKPIKSIERQTKSPYKQPESDTLNVYSKNKLGRTYNPGRPLGMHDREKILELYQKGYKISHIAKIIGVTHSCVSKIMSRYRKTGSMRPRCAQFSQNFY